MYSCALSLPVIAVQAFSPNQVILKSSDIDSQGHDLKPQVPLNLAQQ